MEKTTMIELTTLFGVIFVTGKDRIMRHLSDFPSTSERFTILEYLDTYASDIQDGKLLLQSMAEATAVRKRFFDAAQEEKVRGYVQMYDFDNSNKVQLTRTFSLKYRDGSDIVVVFAEPETNEELRELARKGCEANELGEELFLSTTDPLVAKLLASGRRTRPLESSPLELSLETDHKYSLVMCGKKLEAVENGSEYSNHEYSRAVFGNRKIAEVNASYLRTNDRTGTFSDETEKTLADLLKGKSGKVLVTPCVLGGVIMDDRLDSVFSALSFDHYAYARAFQNGGSQR